MVTVTIGVKTKTLLVPSKNRKKISGSSSTISVTIVNVTVSSAMLGFITNSFVVALITSLIAFMGFVV